MRCTACQLALELLLGIYTSTSQTLAVSESSVALSISSSQWPALMDISTGKLEFVSKRPRCNYLRISDHHVSYFATTRHRLLPLVDIHCMSAQGVRRTTLRIGCCGRSLHRSSGRCYHSVAHAAPVNNRRHSALRIEERFPSMFYCLTFIFSYQLVTMFDDIRGSAWGLMKLLLV